MVEVAPGVVSTSCMSCVGEEVPERLNEPIELPNEEEDIMDGKGYDAVLFSASVSVSVSSPGGLLMFAGFPDRLKTFTDSRPASFSAKWTRGVDGALCTRKCFRMGWFSIAFGVKSPATLGEEDDPLSDDFNGRPFDKITGVLGVRGIEEVPGVDAE